MKEKKMDNLNIPNMLKMYKLKKKNKKGKIIIFCIIYQKKDYLKKKKNYLMKSRVGKQGQIFY